MAAGGGVTTSCPPRPTATAAAAAATTSTRITAMAEEEAGGGGATRTRTRSSFTSETSTTVRAEGRGGDGRHLFSFSSIRSFVICHLYFFSLTTHYPPIAHQHHTTPLFKTPRKKINLLATDEPRLREVFGAYGEVTDVFLPMERGTNRPRGFGFVTFADRASAEDAISKMDQSQLDGRTLRVNESKPRGEGPADFGRGGGGGGSQGGGDGGYGGGPPGGKGLGPGGFGNFNPQGRDEVKLYVGNLSFETTDDSVRGMFEQHGTVTDCFLPTDRDSGRVRGFAFVTMPAKEAEQACAKVNGMELDGRMLRVNEAQPKGEYDEGAATYVGEGRLEGGGDL